MYHELDNMDMPKEIRTENRHARPGFSDPHAKPRQDE